ncbi:MAG TPA: methylmalonyl-CoA mutase family protein [Vitreimonas sp.]|uniref:methylmalonyl-CoA mutase family protein n=1 Tax=Vitreimonas sp. TaxID=3069702 RepID=UPI002D72D8AF|nr:methylmalonyl-CoA mutase family protein [Vitreimonas sp.]HYD89232.1 methylmalonyl-CoA mutase family protein [Vitreimonas sp.]
MTETTLSLGEPADEAAWRALVEQGLKGAQWARLVGKTADGIAIEPLYREPDIATADDVSGAPGAAPFIRGGRDGAWLIRQAYDHPDPARTNQDILADLTGGVGAIELVIDPSGARGVAIRDARDLDVALAGVIIEAAPVSLDAGERGLWAAGLLEAKLKGVAAPGTAFNLDPIGSLMRTGAQGADSKHIAAWVQRLRWALPDARVVRADARPVHEAGGSEAQEIAAALCSGIAYLRMVGDEHALSAGAWMQFAISAGPDVLVEAAKMRALRLCWARVMEAIGAPPEGRAAHIHAFTSRRMLTRYDAWTNILRITTAAFAAGVGGADIVTTGNFTDALGLPTPFARRVARNTQHVLLEECRLGHVADPAGGAWFVEKLTRELAAKAWEIMQLIESKGGIVASLDLLADLVAGARSARQKLIATRRETITGVTDFPLLDAVAPETSSPARGGGRERSKREGRVPNNSPLSLAALDSSPASGGAFHPIRWAEPFEALRDRAEAIRPRPAVFFATLGPLAAFGPRAQFARNLFAAGGVASIGEEEHYASRDQMIDAFRSQSARVAVICGADSAYAEHAENAAQRLKAAGADWVLLAGKPGDSETKLRAAGVDQFIYAGQDAAAELETLQTALGIGG